MELRQDTIQDSTVWYWIDSNGIIHSPLFDNEEDAENWRS